MPSRQDLLEIAKKIRYDLTAAQAKLTELMTLTAQLPETTTQKPICPQCGPITLLRDVTLSDHLHNVHGHDDDIPL